MGKKKKPVIRVVLDTNVLVSSLLFEGIISEIVPLWKTGRIVPLISKETFEELTTVLSYPKFSLTKNEIKFILQQEILPYFEVVASKITSLKIDCRDPDDKKFVGCALLGKAKYLVTGDSDLLDLGIFRSVKIITPAHFIQIMK